MDHSTVEQFQEALNSLMGGQFTLKLEDIPYSQDEWKLWQRNRCGRWMQTWLERTKNLNEQTLKTEVGVALYRAQGASEVLDNLSRLLLEQRDPERSVAEETEDAGNSDS